jgi:transcriptional regulator EpsA
MMQNIGNIEIYSSPRKNIGIEEITESDAVLPAKERRHSEYFDVIRSSLLVNTPEQFIDWVQGDLQRIFPHGMLICGIGAIEKSAVQIKQLITSSFPIEYFESVDRIGGLISSPVVVQWIETRKPVLFELTTQGKDNVWLENFKQYGLHNIAAHGQCDLSSNTTSYFSFSKIPGNLNLKHANLLELLVPHLHTALIRALRNIKIKSARHKINPCNLTKRELEILHGMTSGKANGEIAQDLNISINTVKNHVQHILHKLNVKTRIQAVQWQQTRQNASSLTVT